MTVDTDNKEFQDALNLIQYTRQSVFLTGKAGTGKSTFLRHICANTKKKYVVLAPTGIAAINAGGSTMHSFFKLPFYPILPDDPNLSLQRGRIHEFFKYAKPHRKLLEQIELVIIDEISMVRADIIDAVDRILRVYSRNLREPFGGKQILLVGDVFQLEPVVKNDEREILNRFYPTPYFFSARVFSEIDLVSIELQKVYRQTDPVFVSVLDHIRNNTAGAADLQLLNTRYGTQIEQNEEDMYITLATRRDNVDYINDKKLAELPGEPVTFEGEIEGDFPESSLPTSKDLILKPGAQIIFIKNDYDRRWVNGTIGTISGIDDEDGTIYVITDDGKECDVKPDSWRNIRYRYNEEKKEIEEEVLGTDFQPGGHRLHGRCLCRRTSLCGTQPLHLTGRYPIEETDQPRRYFCTAGNRKLRPTFQQPAGNRQSFETSASRCAICSGYPCIRPWRYGRVSGTVFPCHPFAV